MEFFLQISKVEGAGATLEGGLTFQTLLPNRQALVR